MRRALIVILAVVTLPLGVFVLQHVLFATQYAPGYSEAAFEQIKIGDTEEMVRTALGEPFFRSYAPRDFQYSRSGGRYFWKYRGIRFKNGMVVEKRTAVLRG